MITSINKRRGSQAGFTLVELMISTVILAIMFICSYEILEGNNRAYDVSCTQMDISSSMRNILSRVYGRLSLAELNTISINVFNDVIVFQSPISFAGGVVVLGNRMQYSLGGVNGQQLICTDLDSAATVEVIGNYITNVQFISVSANVVEVRFTLSKTSPKGYIVPGQFSSQINIRN